MSRKGRGDRPPVPYTSDVDYGIPCTLVDQFAPEGKGWAVSDELAQRLLAASTTGASLLEALGGPDFIAWLRLLQILEAAQEHPQIAASREVAEFVGMLAMLVQGAPLNGGAKHVFDLVERAKSARAAQAARKPDKRQDVIDAWLDDERRGNPERGRLARIAGAANLDMPVRTVAGHLKAAGLKPRKAKRE